MTAEEAQQIIDATEPSYQRGEKQHFLRGLQILAKYDDDLRPSFEHDQIWACGFEETLPTMTREDLIELRHCGWFVNEDSWSHF